MAINSRRTLIRDLGIFGTCLAIPRKSIAAAGHWARPIKLGMIADLHGGLAVDASQRLDAFLHNMEMEGCDALVQMGDFAYPNQEHQSYPDRFNAAHDQTVHVIGNHEFDHSLTRKDCFKAWGIEASYYRRDIAGLQVIVLDCNQRGSPTHRGGYPSYIGDKQALWLEKQLEQADSPVLVLSHQPLAGTAAIDNAAKIQATLSRHRNKVLLCLNGHTHVDSLVRVGGVPYLHVNSASYYWVGGETRMAYYTAPLFTTVTIDLAKGVILVSPRKSEWKDKSPEQLGYFDREGGPPQEIVTPQIRSHRIESASN